MFGRPPADVAAAAAAAEFGRLEAVHRSRRFVPWPVVWTLTGAAAGLAVLAGGARLGVLAVGLVPLALLGIGGYLLLPPAGGRRWVALYEHGLVQAVPGAGWVRAVPWADVVAVESGPLAGDLELVLAPGRPPGPLRGWFAAFGESAPLLAGINRHVRPSGVGRDPTGPAVRADELVGLSPAIDGERLRLRRQQARRSLAGLVAVGLLPALLYPAYMTISPRPAAAGAADRVPAAAPASTPAATLDDTPTAEPTTPTPTARPTATPMPTLDTPADVSGYDKFCHGWTFPGAAAYAGRGPHPIEFADITPDFLPDSDLPAAPRGWSTRDPRAVQLVACVTKTPGPVVRNCRYRDLAQPVPLRWLDFSITIRTAGTGRQLARIRVRGRASDCYDVIIYKRGEKPLPQYSTLTPGQLRSVFGRYVTSRVT
jgi:hypothetical protein